MDHLVSIPVHFDYDILSPILLTGTLLNLAMFYSIPFLQDKLVKQQINTLFKQNFTATITPIDKRCEMLINLWISPVDCWYCFLCRCWLLFRIITSEIAYIWLRFGKVCHGRWFWVWHNKKNRSRKRQEGQGPDNCMLYVSSDSGILQFSNKL